MKVHIENRGYGNSTRVTDEDGNEVLVERVEFLPITSETYRRDGKVEVRLFVPEKGLRGLPGGNRSNCPGAGGRLYTMQLDILGSKQPGSLRVQDTSGQTLPVLEIEISPLRKGEFTNVRIKPWIRSIDLWAEVIETVVVDEFTGESVKEG